MSKVFAQLTEDFAFLTDVSAKLTKDIHFLTEPKMQLTEPLVQSVQTPLIIWPNLSISHHILTKDRKNVSEPKFSPLKQAHFYKKLASSHLFFNLESQKQARISNTGYILLVY